MPLCRLVGAHPGNSKNGQFFDTVSGARPNTTRAGGVGTFLVNLRDPAEIENFKCPAGGQWPGPIALSGADISTILACFTLASGSGHAGVHELLTASGARPLMRLPGAVACPRFSAVVRLIGAPLSPVSNLADRCVFARNPRENQGNPARQPPLFWWRGGGEVAGRFTSYSRSHRAGTISSYSRSHTAGSRSTHIARR